MSYPLRLILSYISISICVLSLETPQPLMILGHGSLSLSFPSFLMALIGSVMTLLTCRFHVSEHPALRLRFNYLPACTLYFTNAL